MLDDAPPEDDDSDSAEVPLVSLASLVVPVLAFDDPPVLSCSDDDSPSLVSLDDSVDPFDELSLNEPSDEDNSEDRSDDIDSLDELSPDEPLEPLDSDDVNAELVALSETSLDDRSDDVASEELSLDVAPELLVVRLLVVDSLEVNVSVPVLDPLVPVSSVSCVLVRSDDGPVSVISSPPHPERRSGPATSYRSSVGDSGQNVRGSSAPNSSRNRGT